MFRVKHWIKQDRIRGRLHLVVVVPLGRLLSLISFCFLLFGFPFFVGFINTCSGGVGAVLTSSSLAAVFTQAVLTGGFAAE